MSLPEQRKKKIFSGVDIIDTGDEGMSIGRCQDGLIILVKGAAPGDVVDALVIEKRKGMFITKTTSVSKLSEDRIDPFCSHFGTCGGCKWQHMKYEAQLRFKEKTVHDAYRRIGELDTTLLRPIVGAPLETYYRNKLEFTASDRRWLDDDEMKDFDAVKDKDGIGFHLSGAYDKVLDIKHCYLQAEPSNDIRQFIKNYCRDNGWVFFNLKNKKGFIRNIIIRNNLDGDCMVVLVFGENDRDKIESLVGELTKNFTQIISVYSCVNTKVNDTIGDQEVQLEYGLDSLEEKLGSVVYKIGPKSFFQTNSMQANRLYSIAKEMAGLTSGENVYDLYCGVGSLGLYMADQCRKVIGIELIAEAIEDAKQNARLNNITNADFAVGQVELLLDPSFVAKHGKPDVILTDPPRAGMHPDVIRHLLASQADRIVYVSCNPGTQARDLKMLSPVYGLISATPVDMFPHTHHIECVALLKRK